VAALRIEEGHSDAGRLLDSCGNPVGKYRCTDEE